MLLQGKSQNGWLDKGLGVHKRHESNMQLDKYASFGNVQGSQAMILQGCKPTHEVIPKCANPTKTWDTYTQASTKAQTHMRKYHHGVGLEHAKLHVLKHEKINDENR